MRNFVFLLLLCLSYAFAGTVSAQSVFSIPELDQDLADDVILNEDLNDVLDTDVSAFYTPDEDSDDGVIDRLCSDAESCIGANPDFSTYNNPVVDESLVDEALELFSSDYDFTAFDDSGVDVAICVPPGSNDEPEGATEYRCFTGPDFTETIETCDRVLRASLIGDVFYECERELIDGVFVLSPECAVLDDTEACFETGSSCNTSVDVMSDVTCRVGPDEYNVDETCNIATYHFLEVFETFGCGYNLNTASGLFEPDIECLERLDDRTCSTQSSQCIETVNDDRLAISCKIGEEVDEEEYECSELPQFTVTDFYEWTVARNFLEGSFVKSDELLSVEASGCEVGPETCVVDEPLRPQALSCEIGEVVSVETAQCQSALDVVVDTDYVYAGREVFDADIVSHLADLDFSTLSLDVGCDVQSQLCVLDAPPVYERLECDVGFVQQDNLDFCNVPVDIEVDTDFIYESFRDFDISSQSYVGDAAFITLSDEGCLNFETECVQDRPSSFEMFECASGFQRDFTEVNETLERNVVVDTDYVYLGSRNFDLDASAFVGDVTYDSLIDQSGTLDNCSVLDDTCVTPSGGVFETFECREGYVEFYSNEVCSVSAYQDGGQDYIYSVTGDFNFDTSSRDYDDPYDALVSSDYCSLSYSECLTPSSVLTEEFICRVGQITNLDEIDVTFDLNVIVDLDYIYKVNQTLDVSTGDYVANDHRFSGISTDLECQSLSSTCVADYVGLLRGDVCEVGFNNSTHAFSCTASSTVDPEPEFLYRLFSPIVDGVIMRSVDANAAYTSSECTVNESECSSESQNSDGDEVCSEIDETYLCDIDIGISVAPENNSFLDNFEYDEDQCEDQLDVQDDLGFYCSRVDQDFLYSVRSYNEKDYNLAWDRTDYYACSQSSSFDPVDTCEGVDTDLLSSTCLETINGICVLEEFTADNDNFPLDNSSCGELEFTYQCDDEDYDEYDFLTASVLSETFIPDESVSSDCVLTSRRFSAEDTRFVNTLELTRQFERYDSYSCPTDVVSVDTCEGSRSLAVSEVNRCVRDGLDGECELFEYTLDLPLPDASGGCFEVREEHSCSVPLSTYAGLLAVPTSEISDGYFEASCSSFVENTSCTLLIESCSTGEGSISVSGVEESFDCLTSRRTYECAEQSETVSCDVPDGYSLYELECGFEDREGVCTIEDKVYRNELFDPSFGCLSYDTQFICENEISEFEAIELSKSVDSSDFIVVSVTDDIDAFDACLAPDTICQHGAESETRFVDGLEVSFECWEAERVSSCYIDTSFDECVSVSESELVSSTCFAELDGDCTAQNNVYEVGVYDGLGECQTYSESFVCPDEISSLDPISTTLSVDSVSRDISACESLIDEYDTCVQTETLCLDESDSVVVDGLDVQLSCFEYLYVYECTLDVEADSCVPPSNAILVDRTCTSFDNLGNCTLYATSYDVEVDHPSGGCLEYESNFLCEDLVSTLPIIDETKELISSTWNDTDCIDLLSDTSCTSAVVCESGPETRTLDGLDVSQDCWDRSFNFDCSSSVSVDTCNIAVDAILEDETCLDFDLNGECILFSRDYSWNEFDASGGCHVFESVATCDALDALSRQPDNVLLDYIGDPEWVGNCPSFLSSSNSSCFVDEIICHDDDESERIPSLIVDIDGAELTNAVLSVAPATTSSCWDRETIYICEDTSSVDECNDAFSDLEYTISDDCEIIDETCDGEFRSGECALYERTYLCGVPGTGECLTRYDSVECEIFDLSVAANDNKVSSPDFATNSTVSLISKTSADIRVEVYGSGEISSCDESNLPSSCIVESDVCLDDPNELQYVQLAQNDFYSGFTSFVDGPVTECLNRERIYSCSSNSDVPECTGVEECTSLASTCEIFDLDGSCISTVEDFSCVEAVCELTQFTYDPRAGDSNYVGHQYSCFDEGLQIERVGTSNDGVSTNDVTPDNNRCVDYSVSGCFAQLVHTEKTEQIFHSVQGIFTGEVIEISESGSDFEIRTSEIYEYELYCGTEVATNDYVAAVGYSYGFTDTSPSGLDLSDTDNCSVIESECLSSSSFTNYTTDIVTNYCDVPGRQTYECFSNGNASACGGSCTSETVSYTCDNVVDGAGVGDTSEQVVGSSEDSTCGEYENSYTCALAGSVCVEGAEERLVDGVLVFNDCWRYEDTYQCVDNAGDITDCAPEPECTLIEEQCLSSDFDGTCNTVESIYDCSSDDVIAECVDTSEATEISDPNDESDSGPGLFDIISAVDGTNQGTEQANDELTIYGGERLDCRREIAGVKNCCSFSGPLLLLGCNSEEQRLQPSRQGDQCIENGSFCSRETLFICTQRSRAFCCYENELIKIIVEAGNVQLGRDLGSAENTDCQGFSFDDFAALDLSQVDFSGVAQNILDDAVGNTAEDFEERLRNSIENMQNNNGYNSSETSGG